MILGLAGLAFATGTPQGLVLWSPEPVDPAEILYVESETLGCADLEIQDLSGDPVAFTCEILGSSHTGQVLALTPDTAWSAGSTTLTLGEIGGPGFDVEVVAEGVQSGSIAIPVARTVGDDGVSYQVCQDGVVLAVVRADSAPSDLSQALLVSPEVARAYFGAADDSWPEAAPQATGTFWFATVDGTGASSAWLEDTVTLAAAGMLRTDVRFWVDDACPDESLEWSVGEELDENGGPPVVDPSGEGGDPRGDQGCGCGTGSAAPWLWLALLPLVRRYSK